MRRELRHHEIDTNVGADAGGHPIVLLEEEARQLRRTSARAAARAKGIEPRDWLLVDVAMSAGLRVGELAALADALAAGVPA